MSVHTRSFFSTLGIGGFFVATVIGSSSAFASSSQSPCKLATSAEVKAAFGGTVGSGKVKTIISGVSTCSYSIKKSNLGQSGSAEVFITPGQTASTFATAKKSIPGVVSIPGIGNGAFYNPSTTSIEFIKGTVVANAQAIFLNPGGPQVSAAKVKADTIALAKSVAKHV